MVGKRIRTILKGYVGYLGYQQIARTYKIAHIGRIVAVVGTGMSSRPIRHIAAVKDFQNIGKQLLLIGAVLILPSGSLAEWKGDGLYKGQVKSIEQRVPGQDGTVVTVSRVLLDREGRVVEVQNWTEFGGVRRGDKSTFVTTYSLQGEARWSTSHAEGVARPIGLSFSWSSGAAGRIEMSVSYREDGVFSQMHLKQFDRCDEVTQDINYLAYSPFLLQKDVRNNYVSDCQLAETDATYRNGSRTVTRYDAKGRPVEAVRYDVNGTLSERETLSYNGQGDLILSRTISSDGKIGAIRTVEYEYDPIGNWIKRTSKTLVPNSASPVEQTDIFSRSFEYFQSESRPPVR
jgi:hypothetical protein